MKAAKRQPCRAITCQRFPESSDKLFCFRCWDALPHLLQSLAVSGHPRRAIEYLAELKVAERGLRTK